MCDKSDPFVKVLAIYLTLHSSLDLLSGSKCRIFFTQYKRQILEVENLIALVGSDAVKRSYEA